MDVVQIEIHDFDRIQHDNKWGFDLANARELFSGICGTRPMRYPVGAMEMAVLEAMGISCAPRSLSHPPGVYQQTVGFLRGHVACVTWRDESGKRRILNLSVQDSRGRWLGDPDFEPSLGSEWELECHWQIGTKVVSRTVGRRMFRMRQHPKQRRGKGKKPAGKRVTLRIPPDVVERWKATGRGWQSRMVALVSEQG